MHLLKMPSIGPAGKRKATTTTGWMGFLRIHWRFVNNGTTLHKTTDHGLQDHGLQQQERRTVLPWFGILNLYGRIWSDLVGWEGSKRKARKRKAGNAKSKWIEQKSEAGVLNHRGTEARRIATR